MTPHLCDARLEARENTDQGIGADPFRMWFAASALSVETAAVAHRGAEMPQGHAHLCGGRTKDALRRAFPVRVLVGVEVRGISPHQLAETRELQFELALHGPRV